MYLSAFQETGRALAEAGLISGASGNLSLREGNRLLITTHGSRLDNLAPCDVVETGLTADDNNTPLASSELPVHRAIYSATRARAIVHSHPAHAVTLSLTDKSAAAIAGTPVLGSSAEIIPGALAEEIGTALKTCPLVMVRGHGSFSTGKTLGEALRLTLAFASECRRLCEERGLMARQAEE